MSGLAGVCFKIFMNSIRRGSALCLPAMGVHKGTPLRKQNETHPPGRMHFRLGRLWQTEPAGTFPYAGRCPQQEIYPLQRGSMQDRLVNSQHSLNQVMYGKGFSGAAQTGLTKLFS